MKLAIMQPYFVPYIGYWQLIKATDEFVIFDDVNYIKRGWINRNRILMNGSPMNITMRVKNASQNRKINEIELFDQEEDANKILKTLSIAYKRAPFFMYVLPLLEDILHHPSKNISEFNAYSIMMIADYLSIDTKFVFSSAIEKDELLKSEMKILDICKRQSATHYYNAIGGKELYHHEAFSDCGIELKFLAPVLTEYTQFGELFCSGLSIIDKKQLSEIIDNYELID